MKLPSNADYYKIHSAKDKLQSGEELDDSDRKLLLTVLDNAKGDYFPSMTELNLYESRINRLKRLDPNDTSSIQYRKLKSKCAEFENKYC